MGSITRYSSLERFHEAFGEKVKTHFEKELLGLTITDMSVLSLDYYKSADVTLSDGSIVTVHFGWASEEEISEGKEILDEDDISSEEYFQQCLKGKEIISIETGYERDDNYYAYAHVDEHHALEIPVDFNPESDELKNNSIISEEEFEQFLEKHHN